MIPGQKDFPTVFRKRDVIIILLMALGIYLSLDTASFRFSFEPSWYIDQRFKPASSNYEAVPPVICDLNGDGEKEVVLISKDSDDLVLKIVSANMPGNVVDGIYTPKVIASTALSPLKISKGRVPVALKTGYVESYDPGKGRSQVIVVMREDWTVSCYDSKLDLIWEKAVAHKTHEMDAMIDKFTVDEVAIYLTPVTISDDSNGLVIVGGSMKLRDPSAAAIKMEEGLQMSESGETEHPEMHMRAALEHFSIYALDAKTGHVIWRHDGLDVRPGQFIRGLPNHAYNLDIHDLMTKVHRNPAVNDWSVFRQSLIGEMPHDWHTRDDTSLRMAHFERQHIGGQVRKRKRTDVKNSAVVKTGSVKDPRKGSTGSRQLGQIASGTGSRFTGVETPPLDQSASLPHDAAEHTENPNVIVAHTSKGLEVISLRTGTPVTSLALSIGKSHADLDGDGIVDTISILENEEAATALGSSFVDPAENDGALQHCSVVVTSGLPPRSRLFHGTVCTSAHYLQDSMVANRAATYRNRKATGRGNVYQKHAPHATGLSIPSSISAASPVILRTIDPKTLQESKVRNIVIAINTGLITCYSALGEFKWQIRSGPRWDAGAEETRAGAGTAILFDSDASRVDDLGKHDNVHAQVLVIGDESMSLISREGEILSKIELAKKPIAHPVIGDFNSDGVTDVIIITEEAILGYRLEVVQTTRGLLLAVLALCVITAIVFLANIQTISIDTANPQEQAASISKLVKHSVLFLARSTDESHID